MSWDRKTERLPQIRATKAEVRLIRRLAKRARKSVSAYMRECALTPRTP